MSASRWKPNTTVAAVICYGGRFLLVEEETKDGLRFNQPAGHLDHGESLIAACEREALEETGHAVAVNALIGIYLWSPEPLDDLTYLRFAFAAELKDEQAAHAAATIVNRAKRAVVYEGEELRDLDEGIVRAIWLSRDELIACRDRHRSPLVIQCIDDYLAGKRFSLNLIHHEH